MKKKERCWMISGLMVHMQAHRYTIEGLQTWLHWRFKIVDEEMALIMVQGCCQKKAYASITSESRTLRVFRRRTK